MDLTAIAQDEVGERLGLCLPNIDSTWPPTSLGESRF